MSNLQTSLHSKKQQDQNEYFRKTLQQDKLMNVTSTNLTLKSEITKAQDSMKTTQLKQEKEWVNSIVEVQRNEDRWNKQKRTEQIDDLKQNYDEQVIDRREQWDVTIKNL